jgi:hypothetical protein
MASSVAMLPRRAQTTVPSLTRTILASAIGNLANYFRSDNPPFKRAAVQCDKRSRAAQHGQRDTIVARAMTLPSHCCDRVRNVAFRPQRRILWDGNLRVRQFAGAPWWHDPLRGKSSLALRSGIRRPRRRSACQERLRPHFCLQNSATLLLRMRRSAHQSLQRVFNRLIGKRHICGELTPRGRHQL